LEFGKWKFQLPALADGACPIKHGSVIKLSIETITGELVDRISPWSNYVEQCPNTKVYHSVFYNPPEANKT